MMCLPKKVCLITIHRNLSSRYFLCIHKHQQQRHNNESTKICVFIHYIYVDILFLLTKAVQIMFKRVTRHYQTLHTWISHNVTRCHNFNTLPHALSYIFSQFSIVWGYLQRVTMCYCQIYKKIYD